MNLVDLSRSALLLIDLQKDFVHPEGLFQRHGFYRISDEEIGLLAERTGRLVRAMKAAEKPVLWIKTELREDHADSALPRKTRLDPRLGPESKFLVEGSWGSEFMDGLTPAAGDVVIVKKGSSSFQFTHLDHLLRKHGVDTCIVAGGPVAGALADSIRQGGALGYEMIVAADATFPGHASHLKTLWNRAEIKSTSDVVTALAEAERVAGAADKTALVVVDMQNDFVHPRGLKHRLGQSALSEAARRMIMENNRRLIDAMRRTGRPVVFVVTHHRRDSLDSAPPPIGRRNKPIPAGEDYLVEGSWGAQLAEGLERLEGDLIIVKKGRSGFGFTPLHRVLRNLGVDHCIVTGGAVHGCVEDTVREGAGLGYRLTLVPDALYQPNSPDIAVMTDYAELKTTAQVLAELDVPNSLRRST